MPSAAGKEGSGDGYQRGRWQGWRLSTGALQDGFVGTGFLGGVGGGFLLVPANAAPEPIAKTPVSIVTASLSLARRTISRRIRSY